MYLLQQSLCAASLPQECCQGCRCREQRSMIAAALFAWLCTNNPASSCSIYSDWLALCTILPGSPAQTAGPSSLTLHVAAGVETQWHGGPTVAQLWSPPG